MRTQLGSETSEAGRSYKNAICELGNQFVHRLARLPLHNNFIYNLYTLGKQNKHLNIVHSFTKKVIKDRRQYIRGNGGNNFDDEKDTQADEHSIYFNKKKTAMLDLLLKAERDGLIDEIGVQEEIDTFMFEVSNILKRIVLLLNNNLIAVLLVIIAGSRHYCYRINLLHYVDSKPQISSSRCSSKIHI